MIWSIAVSLAAGLILAWLVLVAFLFFARPKGSSLTEIARILPDTLRLLRRLAADRDLPRTVRIRLVLLLAYVASPIDLIPDFIPVIGYADDAIIASFVLRSVIRAAGPEAVRRHWPGTETGLDVLWRTVRLPGAA